ncbi:MAG: hypothetical protein CYG59_21140 [Chloroflexi bacterium]|nr:MAG: hypothetical protein CYG59_21140 [Chloroflexota bacterium]
MEREYFGEEAPPPVAEQIAEAVVPSDEARLERLLRGVVHTILATYRLERGERLVRRQRRGRVSRLQSICPSSTSNP